MHEVHGRRVLPGSRREQRIAQRPVEMGDPGVVGRRPVGGGELGDADRFIILRRRVHAREIFHRPIMRNDTD